MWLKINLQLNLSAHQNRHFYSLFGENTGQCNRLKKNTHHSLGSIVVANGNFSSESKQREAVPRNKKQSWSSVDFKESI